MNRAKRFLIVAFAISLLLHLLFALLAHPWRGRQENQLEVVSIQRRPVMMTRLQTPPPPKATPKPHPSPAVAPATAQPRSTPGQAAGNGANAATAAPAAAPTPQTTPASNACERSDIDAAVAENPPQPDIPNGARSSGTSGVVAVDVRLDIHGEVTGATVSQSTGNSSLDLVAVAMARGARYTPALHACKPVASAYTFRVRFYAW